MSLKCTYIVKIYSPESLTFSLPKTQKFDPDAFIEDNKDVSKNMIC